MWVHQNVPNNPPFLINSLFLKQVWLTWGFILFSARVSSHVRLPVIIPRKSVPWHSERWWRRRNASLLFPDVFPQWSQVWAFYWRGLQKNGLITELMGEFYLTKTKGGKTMNLCRAQGLIVETRNTFKSQFSFDGIVANKPAWQS